MIGILPYAGLKFYIYEKLKMYVPEEHQKSVITRLSCGALAGLFGQTFTYPLDVVRRQMQVMLPFTFSYSKIISNFQRPHYSCGRQCHQVVCWLCPFKCCWLHTIRSRVCNHQFNRVIQNSEVHYKGLPLLFVIKDGDSYLQV